MHRMTGQTAAILAMALASGACSHTISTAQATPAAHGEEAALATVSIDQLAGMLDRHETVAIFDNNSHEHYLQGHVPGAHWVEFDQVTASVLPNDRNTRLVFYCANEH